MDTIRSIIDERAASIGDKIFLIDPNSARAITFAELQRATQSVAAEINACGINAGQSVAYAMSNSAACAITILGILYGGYRATAINLVAGPQTISYVIQHSEAQLIYSESKQHTLLKSIPDWHQMGLPLRDVDDDKITQWLSLEESQTPLTSSIQSNTDGLLMYTSGTTGTPKGVLLSHANLLAGGENTALAHELVAEDRALCVLPLYHINGLCVTLMGPLVSRSSVVLPDKFSTSAFWSLINQHKCTWFSVVPTQISYLLHADNDPNSEQHNVRFARSASAPLSPEVQQQFEKRFSLPIIETMGLTETAAQILSNPLPPCTRKIGSPGINFGCNVKIADTNGCEVPTNEEGEIIVSGNNVMKGYFKNDEATADAFDHNGWLRTGDLGRQDKDGYVFVTGRLKELIIKGGENIAPREIDEVLYTHPAIIEAAAFAQPCTNYGQRIEAAVCVNDETSISESELLKLCQSQLGGFKSPDKIHFLPELPKGPSGKIQRRLLAEICEG